MQSGLYTLVNLQSIERLHAGMIRKYGPIGQEVGKTNMALAEFSHDFLPRKGPLSSDRDRRALISKLYRQLSCQHLEQQNPADGADVQTMLL